MIKSKWVVAPLLVLAACARAHAADPETNKKAVLGFYDAVSRFDYEGAEPFLGPSYTQHSPMIEDGKEGLRKALNGFLEEFKSYGGVLPKLEVRIVIADGDYVTMLSQVTGIPHIPGGILVADLFRLENGKLVEHWDITERLAKPSTGMFDSLKKR